MEIAANIASAVSLSAVAGIIALGGWWLAVIPQLAVILLCISLLAGQLLRVPILGQGGGLLVSDIATVGVLWVAGIQYIKHRRIAAQARMIGMLLIPFISWSLFGLFINAAALYGDEFGIAFLYWLRLTAHLLLLPALVTLCLQPKIRAALNQWFLLSLGILISLGFIQLLLIPQLANISILGVPANILQRAGWDPHIGRLVSTWLDPNFFGALLITTLPFIITVQSTRMKKVLWAVAMVIALAFTQSRSAFVGILGSSTIGTLLLWLRVPKKIPPHKLVQNIILMSFLIVWMCFVVVLLGDRFIGIFDFDPTVALRQESLQAVWIRLVVPNPVIGVGYNAYQFAAQEEGLISSFAVHSRAGADNSYLTLWATTGMIGVILFLAPWVYMIQRFTVAWIIQKHTHALAALLGIIALSIHAQFVNSFLYGHLLIALIVICSLALTYKQQEVV